MITATADQIAEVIAADHEMLRMMRDFLDAVTGDADIGEIIAALPQAIAGCSPFENEAALVETVRIETLKQLHALTLSRLPAKGNA